MKYEYIASNVEEVPSRRILVSASPEYRPLEDGTGSARHKETPPDTGRRQHHRERVMEFWHAAYLVTAFLGVLLIAGLVSDTLERIPMTFNSLHDASNRID